MNANLIIKASAGTGKTFAIATRYLQLLVLGKARPEQILALTFSRAAAQEIYDKILERLWRAAGADVSPSGKSAAEVAAARSAAALEERDYLLDGLPASQRAQAERAADWSPDFFASLLRRVIDAQHHDTIATLDSFILRIVRSFPLEMGFQREVSVLDDYGRSLAVEKAIEAVLASTGDDRSLKDDFLAAQENSAVRSGLSKTRDAAKTWGPFLHDRPEAASWSAASMLDALGVEASPSMPDLSAIPVTGKTTGLPDKVLDRVLKFSGGRVKDGDIFKNQAGECLSFFLDNPQATSFSPPSAKHPKATEFGVQGADAVRAAARWMVATLFSRKLNVVAAKLRLASALETAYDASTRRKGMLTFSDFTDCQAANENSEKGLRLQNLQFRLDARFDHWALDEFQDTSMPQWNCLRRLVDEALSGDGGSVMAVGDFKQSIYAWRGGDDQPFKELIAAVSAAGGAVAPLDLSHRYQKNTADFVNAVFCPSNVRAVAGGDCAEAQDIWEHDCWPRGGHVANGADDFVEIVGVRPDAADAAPAPDAADDDGDADLHPSAAMRILARPVCDCVRALIERRLAEKSALEATGRPFKPDSIGILVRNNADGLYLAERLRAAKTSAPGGSLPIPVVWEGQSGVLDAPAVRALLELLWLAEHPEDSFSWAVVNEIFPVRAAILPDASSPAAVSAAVSRRLSKSGLARTLRSFVAALNASPEALDDRSRMRLDELVREGVNFEARPDASGGVAAFRRYLASVSDREVASSPVSVRILTIHRSKGLSIDHVIVPVTESGSTSSLVRPKDRSRLAGDGWVFESLPASLAAANEKTRQAWALAANGHFLEDLRTWYVALTRARKSTRVFVVDEDRGAAAPQFRDLLLRPFGEPPAFEKDALSRIRHAVGASPTLGGPAKRQTAPAPAWTPLKGQPYVRHATPSTGPASSKGAPARKATDLFNAGFGAAARRGIDEHSAFASIGRIDPVAPSCDRERSILSWDDCWRRAFVLPSEATLWRERPYELFDQSKGEWETGQFDRVVFRPDGSAEIYDFKTNRIFDGEPAEVFGQRMRKTYSAQMNAYRRALSRLCAIDESRISTTLLLTATGTSVKIES